MTRGAAIALAACALVLLALIFNALASHQPVRWCGEQGQRLCMEPPK